MENKDEKEFLGLPLSDWFELLKFFAMAIGAVIVIVALLLALIIPLANATCIKGSAGQCCTQETPCPQK